MSAVDDSFSEISVLSAMSDRSGGARWHRPRRIADRFPFLMRGVDGENEREQQSEGARARMRNRDAFLVDYIVGAREGEGERGVDEGVGRRDGGEGVVMTPAVSTVDDENIHRRQPPEEPTPIPGPEPEAGAPSTTPPVEPSSPTDPSTPFNQADATSTRTRRSTFTTLTTAPSRLRRAATSTTLRLRLKLQNLREARRQKRRRRQLERARRAEEEEITRRGIQRANQALANQDRSRANSFRAGGQQQQQRAAEQLRAGQGMESRDLRYDSTRQQQAIFSLNDHVAALQQQHSRFGNLERDGAESVGMLEVISGGSRNGSLFEGRGG